MKLFIGLNIESKLALNYPNLYLIRRYLATTLLVFLWKRHFALLQIFVYTMSTIAFIIYVLTQRPYSNKPFNGHEVTNECFLMMLLYTVLFSTNYNNVPGHKEFLYHVGWVVIGILLTVILWNIGIILRRVLLMAILRVKRVYYRSSLYRRRMKRE